MRRSMMGRKKGGMAIEGAPNGVYILRTDNRLYTEKMWKKEWNSDAVGVAFISNACRFVIAPTESETELWWNVDAPTIPGVITTNDWDTARIDYAGVANSTAMIKALGRERSHAAGWCNQYLFKNGKNGYLGACGEWDYVDGYLTDIGYYMSLIGGVELSTFSYWTSTQYDDISAWTYFVGNGYADRYVQYGKALVRAFAPL